MFVLGLFLGIALFVAIAITFASPLVGVPAVAALIGIAIVAHRGQWHWEEWDFDEHETLRRGEEWSGGYFQDGSPMAINGGIALGGPVRISGEN